MTQVKICGITNLEDALVAVEARADMLGFIFYEPSPRYVRPETVREIVSSVKCQVSSVSSQSPVVGGELPSVGAQSFATDNGQRTTDNARPIFVGVFVNHSLETVAHLLDFCGLDAAQLHGEESPEFVNHFQGRAFKALRPQSLEEAEASIEKYLPCSPAPPLPYSLALRAFSVPTPYFLLDAYHPNLYGGTGQVADWGMAAAIARRYPIPLAGSLTPENVAEAVRVVRPLGVDVSSGVEREKGKKDHEKVRGLVEAVRTASN